MKRDRIKFELVDEETHKTHQGWIVVENGTLMVHVDGYTGAEAKASESLILALEVHGGHLRTLAWPNKTQPEPEYQYFDKAAVKRLLPCPDCHGTGEDRSTRVDFGEDCRTCLGTGKIGHGVKPMG